MKDTGYRDINNNPIYEHSCVYQILDNSKEELEKYGHNLFGYIFYDKDHDKDNDGWMMRVIQNSEVKDWDMPQRCIVLDGVEIKGCIVIIKEKYGNSLN